MTQRDWQKDMERVNIFEHAKTLCNNPFPPSIEHEPTEVALGYWLQEAKERGEREQEIKRAIGRCLVAGNSLGSIIMNYNLPEGHEEWSFQEANSYFFGKFYNDRPSAYESYETWIAWKAIMGASEIMSTLYPDTPAPTPLKTRHVCFHCDGEKRFMIPHEDQAPTIEPCEICNGEGTLLYDEEQLKRLLPDLAPKEGQP
ncbi:MULTISPECIES: hypothetical protein [Paenibacillus]|uniref:hypothetical protein n=1 Tax=Paenibacillus TaxID=44249 RepID=UPI00096C9ADC|nr:hypothetical protein [Paenibacillus odorifer]OME04649.1 hypothetical protein BSK60_33265 [Paenibacillus odorifer]